MDSQRRCDELTQDDSPNGEKVASSLLCPHARPPNRKWHAYTTFWPPCSDFDERIKDSAPRLCPFRTWHMYTTFWPPCSDFDEFMKDYAHRLFRRREGLFSLLLVCSQSLLNVWCDLLRFPRERRMSQGFCTSRRSFV